MSKYRLQKLTNLFLKLLNEVLITETKNFPFLKGISFTHVYLSNDRGFLRVSIDAFDRSNIDEIADLLNKNVKIFRSYLAANLSIRSVPKIVFKVDDVFERVTRLEQIIDEINNVKEKK